MRELPSIRMLPVALLITGLYLFLHPYQGLIHDARLYTLQALNHLHPDLYSNDVFLKYGSQDSYTLFTPVYAVGSAGIVCADGVDARTPRPVCHIAARGIPASSNHDFPSTDPNCSDGMGIISLAKTVAAIARSSSHGSGGSCWRPATRALSVRS